MGLFGQSEKLEPSKFHLLYLWYNSSAFEFYILRVFMENRYKLRALWIIAVLSLAPIACEKSYVTAPISASLALTPTPTNMSGFTSTPTFSPTFTFTSTATNPGGATSTPSSFTPTYTSTFSYTPTFTFTYSNTPTDTSSSTPTNTSLLSTSTFTFTKTATPVPGTPTFTPTPIGTMGLMVVGIFLEDLTNVSISGYSYSVTATTCTVYISTNLIPDTTAAVTLITPLNGSIPVTYTANTTYSGVSVAEYVAASDSFTYVPNSPYSLYAVTSLGTAAATVNAPGNITIAANGSTASAVYPGNYDSAVVEEISPAAVTTYQSPTGTSVGSPFTYPVSAYPAPAGTGTYGVAYNAAVTDIIVAGPSIAVGSAWIGDEVDLTTLTR